MTWIHAVAAGLLVLGSWLVIRVALFTDLIEDDRGDLAPSREREQATWRRAA